MDYGHDERETSPLPVTSLILVTYIMFIISGVSLDGEAGRDNIYSFILTDACAVCFEGMLAVLML